MGLKAKCACWKKHLVWTFVDYTGLLLTVSSSQQKLTTCLLAAPALKCQSDATMGNAPPVTRFTKINCAKTFLPFFGKGKIFTIAAAVRDISLHKMWQFKVQLNFSTIVLSSECLFWHRGWLCLCVPTWIHEHVGVCVFFIFIRTVPTKQGVPQNTVWLQNGNKAMQQAGQHLPNRTKQGIEHQREKTRPERQ